MNNNEFIIENQHLNDIKQKINKQLDLIKETKDNKVSEIREQRRYMWQEVSQVARDIGSAASMAHQNDVIASAERHYDNLVTSYKILQKQLQVPYFARIDFKEDGYISPEKIYIGNFGFIDKEKFDVLICDWRSDIASMYYNHELGRADFNCSNGLIQGDISLKRQFEIKNGKLENFFDTPVAIEDHFLKQILSSNASDKMKTIVTSIQKSQNEIIREQYSDILIINGCAGSGKTSIALHRIAYLLYKLKDSLSVNNFLIFSPNEIFNSYISSVLPDLGEENVYQTTFAEFAQSAFEKNIIIESFIDFTSSLSTLDNLYKQKNDSNFYDFITSKISSILNSFHFDDLYLSDILLFKGQQLSETFYSNLENLSYIKSYQRLNDLLSKKTRDYKKILSDRIQERLINENGAFYYVSNEDLKSDVRLEYMKLTSSMQESFKNSYHLDCIQIYKDILCEYFNEREGLSFESDYKTGFIKHEDTAPFMLIKFLLGFFKKDNKIKHIVIDEAQDYSFIQYQLFLKIYDNAKFTILGDINQKLIDNADFIKSFEYGIKENEIKKSVKSFELNVNYRSSEEIVEFTNNLIGKDLCTSVKRNGEKVISQDIYKSNLKSTLKNILENISGKTAVITSTKQQAQTIHKMLDNTDICLVVNENNTINKNICIIPVFLSKGLEFDNCVVLNFENSLKNDYLYIACTRALHKLYVFDIK